MGASWGGGGGGAAQPGDVITGPDVDASLAANLPSGPSAGAIHRISVAGTFENSADIEPVGFYFEVGDYIYRNQANTKWNPIAGNNDIDNSAYGAGWSSDVANGASRAAIYNEMETRLKDSNNLSDLNSAATARNNLGLGNVDDTSDADKPVSTAQQSALDGKLDIADNLSDLNNAATARTNLGLGSVDNTSDADKPVSTAQQSALDGKLDIADNLSDLNNAATARTNLGLGNVNNTSDANKPVSTAQQAAIDAVAAKTITWSIETTPHTAIAGQGIFADTSGAAYALTLPATPTLGQKVSVSDFKGNASTNNITIGRNGSNIDGVAEDLVIDLDKTIVTLVYSDASTGWSITELTQVA